MGEGLKPFLCLTGTQRNAPAHRYLARWGSPPSLSTYLIAEHFSVQAPTPMPCTLHDVGFGAILKSLRNGMRDDV